jgi:hypothetical protein
MALLIVVIGDGKLVVPVDFALRRPTPKALEPRTVINCKGFGYIVDYKELLWSCPGRAGAHVTTEGQYAHHYSWRRSTGVSH